MGIAERKHREKEEMRERILNAAISLFLKEGYDKTSIRQIADAIEYSPATIYLYFKDKDDLFYAIHQRGFEKLFTSMAQAVATPDPLERLRTIGRLYLRFALENPEFYDLMFVMRAPISALKERAACGEATGDWHYGSHSWTLLVQTIQDCIDQYLIRIPNAEEGALLAWSVVHGMACLYIRERMDVIGIQNAEATMEAVLDHLTRILKI